MKNIFLFIIIAHLLIRCGGNPKPTNANLPSLDTFDSIAKYKTEFIFQDSSIEQLLHVIWFNDSTILSTIKIRRKNSNTTAEYSAGLINHNKIIAPEYFVDETKKEYFSMDQYTVEDKSSNTGVNIWIATDTLFAVIKYWHPDLDSNIVFEKKMFRKK